MVRMKRRALSFVVLGFFPAMIVMLLFLLYVGPSLLGSLGISYADGLIVMMLPALAMSMIFVVLWQHFAMKLSFPPFSQAFLHPNVMKKGVGKAIVALSAFIALKSLVIYLTMPIASSVSIMIVLGSSYVVIVEFEIAQHFAEYLSLNPLKRKDEL